MKEDKRLNQGNCCSCFDCKTQYSGKKDSKSRINNNKSLRDLFRHIFDLRLSFFLLLHFRFFSNFQEDLDIVKENIRKHVMEIQRS